VEAAHALGLEPGGYSKKLDIDLDAVTGAAAAMVAIHRRLFEIMKSNEWGLGLDLDSEFLHDFRVAVRRTRSALSQIKGVFPKTSTDHFKREFSWLGKITSPCRDLDVWRLKLPSYASILPSEIRRDLEPLRVFLDRHQKTEHQKVVALLESTRYAYLKRDWKAFLDTDPASLESQANSSRPILELASERIWRNYKRVLARGSAVDADSAADTLHKLRIDCKKLRYLLEFFRRLYPPAETRQLIEGLKRLQDNLGDFNDFEVLRARLQEFEQAMALERVAPATTVLAMGHLAQELEEGQRRERERFHRRYEKFSSRKNRQRFKELFKSPGEGRT
ncbi:MAG: CHAD domain-containing protein, partial [Acidobacteriota bacterium]